MAETTPGEIGVKYAQALLAEISVLALVPASDLSDGWAGVEATENPLRLSLRPAVKLRAGTRCVSAKAKTLFLEAAREDDR